MSLKSTIQRKLGLSDVDDKFLTLYRASFLIQNIFDTDPERKKILKLISKYTHVNYTRLKFLYDLANNISLRGLEGSFVEMGSWRGGCAGIMAYVSKKNNYRNSLYFFDSFEGLPEPTVSDGKDALIFAKGKKKGKLKSINKVRAEIDYIKKLLFEELLINPKKVKIVKGWFQETLPEYNKIIKNIAILRLDGDWYESTKIPLQYLYNLVVKGGYIVIDDYYYWDGCKRAVNEFIEENNLKVQIRHLDMSGAYFLKP